MKLHIKYRRATITITVPIGFKPTWCEGCGRKIGDGAINKLDCHHWKYAYETQQVRENPMWVLHNTNWLCVPCHDLGDAMRKYHDKPKLAEQLEVIRLKALEKGKAEKKKEENKNVI
jgi:hypothetical protein